MSEVKKLKIGNTSYDIVDSSAAHALTDIAQAGTNITFTTPTIDDYSIAGTGVTVSSGIASGFSSSSCIYKSGIWNTIVNAGSIEFNTKIKVNSLGTQGIANINSGTDIFKLIVNTDGTIQTTCKFTSDTKSGSSTAFMSTNTDYWLKLVFTSGEGVSLKYSTNGSSYTEIWSASTTQTNFATATYQDFALGALRNYHGSISAPLDGTIDLTETNFKDANGNILWAPVTVSGIPQINAAGGTVDQTYNASSANAQSGVAINGAGFLKNSGTYNYEVVLKSPDSNTRLNASNALVEATGYRVNIGNGNTNSQNYGLSIGTNCTVQDHGIAIGWYARTNYTNAYDAIAIGSSSSSSSPVSASGDRSIAIGYQAQATSGRALAVGSGAHATGNYSSAYGAGAYATGASNIQLGLGTNSTDNSLSVGFYNNNSPVNYQLLDSSGNIPAARLGTLPASDGTYIPVLTITDGTPSISWVSYSP